MLKLLLVRSSDDDDDKIVVEDDPATTVNNAGDIRMLQVTNERNDSARRDKANIIALFRIKRLAILEYKVRSNLLALKTPGIPLKNIVR